MAKSKKSDRGKNTAIEGRLGDKRGDVEAGKQENQGNIRLQLDTWQEEVIKCQDNIALRAGRQVGKSTAIAVKASNYATSNPKQSIMIISATERQAFLLFSKVLGYLHDNFRSSIKMGKNRPTKSEIKLTNGSIIRCLPTGLDGLGIRGYTVNLLIADEAAFIPEAVWQAVTPMLSTTGGKIILLSTPFGKDNYFYRSYFDKNFRTWHINAEIVADSRPEPQKTFMKDFQEKEKARMTRLQYAQEYLGEFVDELRQLFSDDIIARSCTLKRPDMHSPYRDYYLGIDIARLGEDEGTYEIIRKINRTNMIHVENIITKKKLTTETFDTIVRLESQWNFKRIGIDAGSGSLGVGILDFLLREPTVKRKVIALNNLQRQLDHLGERKRTLLKEDMYMNMLALMEKGILKLLDDDEICASLKSVQYEYVITEGKKTSVRIFGNYTHIAEGLIRAAWVANQKSLNAFIDWI